MTTTLYPTWTLGDLELTDYPYSVEFGGDHGAPETLSELVTSMLGDGDLVRKTGDGNREISIVVVVEGPTLGALAENEATLRAECTKRTTLTFEPGDIDSVPSVFEVLLVAMQQPRDEVYESHLMRRWELTLTCAPFARSAELVTVSAISSGTTTVLVDDCTSAVGWTGTRSGVANTPLATWDVGSVGVAELDTAITSPETWTLTPPAVFNFSATPYLVAEIRTISSDAVAPFNVTAHSPSSGGALPVMSVRKIDGGYYRAIYDGTGFGSTKVEFRHVSSAGTSWQGLFVRNLERSDVTPNITARQLTRTLAVGGTERTSASIQISPNEATALGFTIVHTYPENGSGYSPPLRRWRTSGNTVSASTALMSGALEPVLATPVVFEVPTGAVPEGEYVWAALMRSTQAGTFPVTCQVRTSQDSVYFGGSELIDREMTFGSAGTWILQVLGVVTLPTGRATNGKVQLDMLRTPTTDGELIEYDEQWIFRVGDGCALTMLSTTGSFLWLDSPDVSSPVPRVWRGGNGDRTDARHPGGELVAMGNHVLVPPATTVFTGASTAPMHSVSATYYPRWHSNAAD